MCVQCGYPVCTCPLIPESTVGRLAKELDIDKKELASLFSFDSEQFAHEASDTATAVLERLGGYAGLVQKFPFDRGETNRTLVQFCLKLAETVESDRPGVAERLRSAAMQVLMAATYAGSKKRPGEINRVIGSIQNTLPEIGVNLDDLIAQPDSPFLGQLGRLLKKRDIRILLVFANPRGTDALRLGEEERAIREAISLSKARDLITLATLSAATVDDLRRKVMDAEYDIIHFSGHGEVGALIFETADGHAAESPIVALSAFVKRHPAIKCVILNACYSLSELIPIAPHTIGMEKAIDDQAAIEFARGFYDAVGAGKDFDFAVEEGKSAAALKGYDLPIKVLAGGADGPA